MEIDSDQFGDLVVDMADVAAIYAYRPHIYQFEDRSTKTGVGILRGKQLEVDGELMPAEAFMGMVEGSPRERDYWYMKLNLSLAVRKGNTNQSTLSDRLFVRRDAASNRFTLDTNGSIGQSDGTLNVQKQIGTGQFDVFISKAFYITALHHGQLTLALEVTDVLDTTISVIYDRVEEPEPNEDGSVPDSNDIELNFGVQLELG